MSDDLARRVRAARPSAVATVPARDRALAASRAALADGPRGASARRAARLALAVAGLAAAAAAAAVAVALVLAGGADEAPRIILPGDHDAPSAASATSTSGEQLDGVTPPAPDFDLEVLRTDGAAGLVTERANRESLRGSVIVLAFTASWCEPCAGLPALLQRLSADHAARGAAVIAVASYDLRDTAEGLAIPGTGYALALDANGEVREAYGIAGLPEVVVIDRSGGIAARLSGAEAFDEAQAVVARLVEQPRPLDPSRVETPLDTAAFDAAPLPGERARRALSGAPCEVSPDRVWQFEDADAGTPWRIARGPGDQVVAWSGASGGCSPASEIAERLATTGLGIWSVRRTSGGGASFSAIVARRVTEVILDGRRIAVTGGIVRGTSDEPARSVTVVVPEGRYRVDVG